jgi:hypothetical protein
MTTGATGPTGPAIKTFYIKTRRTSPFLYETVEAMDREMAINQLTSAIPEGEQLEVMDVTDITGMEGPTGTTGASGPTGTTGASGAARK